MSTEHEPRKVSTLDEQVICLERELAMRQKVYPGLVAKKKMSDETAQKEIFRMHDALRTLSLLKQFIDGL